MRVNKSKATRRLKADPKAPPRAVAYLRLSGEKEEGSDTEESLEAQEDYCRRKIAELGGLVIAVESDIARGNTRRLGVERAKERIRSGECDSVIVWRYDRLARGQLQIVYEYEIKELGGRLISATEKERQEGRVGRFEGFMDSETSGSYSEETAKKVNDAFAAKFPGKGRYKVGSRPPYGYRQTGAGKEATYDINPAEAEVVKRIYQERARGASIRTIYTGLNADHVPTPSGRGKWGTKTVHEILRRPTYATGQHECWRTATQLDAGMNPYTVERPADERYYVAFPAFLDPALFHAVKATSERNVWCSRRNDRPAEYGLLRYGFVRCGSCGRALSLAHPTSGKKRPRYSCRSNFGRECSSRPSIVVDVLDQAVWAFVRMVMEDPLRGASFKVVHLAEPVDSLLAEALQEAETKVAAIEERVSGLLDNLALLTGTAAKKAAARLNDINEELDQATEERNRLAALTTPREMQEIPHLVAVEGVAQTVQSALEAMLATDPAYVHGMPLPELDLTPTREPWIARITDAVSKGVAVRSDQGPRLVQVPMSWDSMRAAISVLGLTVILNQEESELPRWVATMKLPSGIAVGIPSYPLLSPRSRRWASSRTRRSATTPTPATSTSTRTATPKPIRWIPATTPEAASSIASSPPISAGSLAHCRRAARCKH
jgi:site-specific DNA recombinase